MKFYNEQTKEFIFENYHKQKPFASFLPGIAGKNGVPMWTYYVNRGQLISSFGIESKEHAIMDFTPANLSYKYTPINGFRTFVKVNGKSFEPFGTKDQKRLLKIGKNKVSIAESTKDLDTEVKYFNVTGENYPGLVRKVIFTAKTDMELAFVDGLANFWPYGTGLYAQKNMANLAVAWFDVFNLENRIPFMKNRSTTEDTEEVGTVEAGNFYVTVDEKNEKLFPVYDPSCVFDYYNDLSIPYAFNQLNYDDFIKQPQASTNQLLAGFSTAKVYLKSGESYSFYTLMGSFNSQDSLNNVSQNWTFSYFKDLEQRAEQFIESLVSPMQIETSNPLFDAYMEQAFLDNLLRGGFPYIFKSKDGVHVYHTFSRIHGDMEREYNNFYVEPKYYSHGNGSYRDVNQNRRNDVYFVKEAGLFNLKQFIELIQTDGHNPLTIEGSRFEFDQSKLVEIKNLVSLNFEKLENFLKSRFTPGALLMFIESESLTKDSERLLENILFYSRQITQSSFGTGYWSDHWIYNLDLLELYLNVYPDKLQDLLFNEKVAFYQSHMSVYPRKIKYVLNHQGMPRQLGPLYHDQEKIDKLKLKQGSNFHKNELGEEVKVQLYTKFLHLALIKTSSLDPYGMGVMMDSEKPGWNDAMNGLPAIFGSGLTETINLSKLLKQLLTWTNQFKDEKVYIPNDIYQFFNQLVKHIHDGFNVIQDIRESFDQKTRFYLDSKMVEISLSQLEKGIKTLDAYVDKGIDQAFKLGNGLIPTYLTFEAVKYEKNGLKHPHLKLDSINVLEWKVRPLPYYLEAPAHYLKSKATKKEAKTIHRLVHQSGIFDEKLGLYKTSASLEKETLEIGRARAFTEGWLEREASFVHMSYKYLIGMFKSGLYKEFYQDIKSGMPPFMNPLVYGRSTLENVSFIATSNNPNPKVHGRGFVARLTGTTSEALTLAYLMFIGKHPFEFINDELTFKIEPKLKKSFFKNGLVSIKFLTHIKIIIHNEYQKDTFNQKVTKYVLYAKDQVEMVESSIIKGKLAKDIRDLKYEEIHVYLGK